MGLFGRPAVAIRAGERGAGCGVRGACGSARAARAAARAGMGFRVVVGTALAVLLLCGVSLAAPAAGGAFGEMPARDAGAGSDHAAAGLEEELRFR